MDNLNLTNANSISAMWKRSSNKIRNKLFFALLIITLLPILLISSYSLIFTTNKLHHSSLSLHATKIDLISEKIQHYLGQVNSDLFYLRDSNALNLYLSAMDSSSAHKKRLMLTNLRTSFKKFSNQKRIYDQIHFIDSKGMERVGIDYAENQAHNISDTNLQDRKNTAYFQNAMVLNKDGLFISTLNMNQFDSIIVKQKPPTINYSTPVYDNKNKLLGIISLNVDMRKITAILANEAQEGTQIQFVNPDGFYYSNDSAEPQTASIFSDKQKLRNLIQTSTSGNLGSDDNIITYRVININDNKFNLGVLLGITPKNIVFATENYFLYFFIGVIVLTLAITFILALLLSDLITQPILALTDNVDRLSKGDLETPILVESTDEIGKLTSAIERLRKSMKILMKRVA